MHHLRSVRVWQSVAAFFFAVLITGPVGNRIWEWPNFWPLALVGLVSSFLAAEWRRREGNRTAKAQETRERFLADQQHREQLRAQFALCKLATELRPRDFGFQALDPGEEADPHFRPFYPTYVSRRIVPFDGTAAEPARTPHNESSLRTALVEGRGFVLHGSPTMGKSRTLYQVVVGLADWVVISPRRDRPAPPSEAFEATIAGSKVILLIEDLNDFAEAVVDLVTFCGPDGLGKADTWVVAGTCRDGPELAIVRETVGNSLRRFYDDVPLRLALVPQSAQEKAQVARGAGRQGWILASADYYPTPGAIVMEEALRFMRGRFELLPPEDRDLLRALKLLARGGVLPFTHRRLALVLERIFQRRLVDLVDHLELLGDQAFIRRPSVHDPVLPEPAYIQDSVTTYPEGRDPMEDFPLLVKALSESRDARGLTLLGATHLFSFLDPIQALDCFDSSLRLNPDDIGALHGKAVALGRLGREKDVIAVTDNILRHYPNDPAASYNRAHSLAKVGQLEDALSSFNTAIEQFPQYSLYLFQRGMTLAQLGRLDEALADFDAALTARASDPDIPGNLRPSVAIILGEKGAALGRLGSHREALDSVNASLRLAPGDPDVLFNKVLALDNLESYVEALYIIDALLENRPENLDVLYQRGITLMKLGRFTEAQTAFCNVLREKPTDPDTLVGLVIALAGLERWDEARDTLNNALRIDPDHSAATRIRKDLLRLEGSDTSHNPRGSPQST